MNSILSNFSHIASFAYAAAILAAATLSSCNDDNPISSKDDKRVVSFNVEISKSLQTPEATRSGETENTGTLLLKGDTSPLYLHPKCIDGIQTGKTSRTATRASLTDNDNIGDFGVFASIKPDGATSLDGIVANYMSNVEVTRDNNWTPVAKYLWPGVDALHFNAYSPYLTSAASEGITRLPSASDSGELSLSYSTPADVADQQDLLISTPVDSKSSPCNLSFNHALTAIRFAAGSEMVPCTVRSISIAGVKADGTLNMETGEWSNLSSTKTFTVNPNVTLSAAEGSKFVEPASEITSDKQTFLLIPQTLGEDAEISITFDFNGEEKVLTTSLNGTSWNEGKTIIYRISANPASEEFILQLTDEAGNPISQLTSNYTGTTLNFKVRSAYGEADDPTTQKDVAWKAEFVDDNGNVISKPQWISAWTMNGSGSTSVTSTTTMQTPVFEAISEESRTLRNASDINETSGYRPYNLANSTGQASPQNTANCYLIHAPGFYAIPLVYGNAISDGKTNTSAYSTSASSNTHILKNFVNHLGEAITDPYIYNNANCVPEDAVLVWEGRLNLIQKVQLSPDKKRLIFVISPDFICQGNAIVAVRDKSGTILWSWHLWVTPYDPDTDAKTISYHGKNYELMTRNLGQVTSGDRANFTERTTKIRYTQIPDDGSEPLTVTIALTQSGKIVVTPNSYNYYQWGRKDPMISDIAEWYTTNYQEVTRIWTKNFETDRTSGIPIIADYIRTPGYFWTSSHNTEAFPYYNLWNTNNSTTDEVKTIYDPSPIGYMVARNVLTPLHNQPATVTTGNMGTGVSVTLPDSEQTIFFPCQGYRQSSSGELQGENVSGTVWTSATRSTTASQVLVVGVNLPKAQVTTDPRAMGFGIKSTKEIK